MPRNSRVITYAVHKEDGLVISRMGDQIAYPVIEYEAIYANGSFGNPVTRYLEKIPLTAIPESLWKKFNWTKKVPIEIKNKHREFWGLKALKIPS